MSKNKKTLVRILATGILLILAVVLSHLLHFSQLANLGIFLAIYLLISYDVLIEAVGGIGRGQIFDENFLMGLATVGAFVTGQYPEAVSVILLYQIGELFQRYAVGKSRGSISALMELSPDTSRVLKDGEEMRIASEEVQVGNVVIVKPGERVPLDGIIEKGESLLDTSALTGESIPRRCEAGDEVLSGVIVLSGVLEIRVQKAYYDSTAAKILDMVENAATKKAKTERFITKFARIYTPIVVCAAVLMAIIPPIFGGAWIQWLQKAMNFLVISCPCAFVISVPMTFFSGIGTASRMGILIKGGNYLEILNRVDTFVFDKTGTLTEGKFAVAQVTPQARREEILRLAAIAECGSNHPIAHSILEAAGEVSRTGWDLKEEVGFGVSASNGTEIILAGNSRFMEQNHISVPVVETDGTVVYVARNDTYIGMIEIADTLKPDTKPAIAELKRRGAKTVMLTGDHCTVAEKIAAVVGIDLHRAELLPVDKVQVVEELLARQKKGKALAFVGDGINDAPVLMRADVGIAMGGIGSDAAIEAADVVLMRDDISSILEAKKIASKTMGIVWQNIIFSLGVKLLVLLLTPFGLVSIWLAIFADVGVAVLAILNAMRVGKGK